MVAIAQATRWNVLIPRSDVHVRIREVAEDLRLYIESSDRPVTLAIVTQGGVWFGMKLLEHLPAEKFYWGLVGTSSYRGAETGGKVDFQFSRLGDVAGKNVVIVDDIGDRRKTLQYLRRHFLGPEEANEVRVCVLLNKPDRKECDVPLDFVGFNIPDTFVAGCGLDGGQGFAFTRNFPDVRYKEGTLPEGVRPYWLPEKLPA